jgi:Ser/Thr protein kinase RdoA (MazF antagonist)
MRDLGAAELGKQNEAMWFKGVVALAGLQQEWLGHTAELTAMGLPTRSLTKLAELTHDWSDDDEMVARMPPELQARWEATAPALEEDCLRLDGIGPGSSILHGDFHPWNVTFGADVTRTFDWTDACVSHPFLDLATYVFRTKQTDIRRQLMDSYLARWHQHLPDAELAEAGRLALIVGALNQVQTYRTLIPTLMTGDVLHDADIDWVKRALTRRELGLDSPT